MTSSSRWLLRALVAIAVLAILIAWVRARSRAQAAAARAAAAPRPVPVLLAPVEQHDVPIWVEGLGTVSAWQQVAVRPQVDGRLERVLFKEGQTVRRGDQLAQIDPRPFLVQLHQAEGGMARDRALVDQGKLNLERYRSLRRDNLIAQQQVDDQAATVGQAEGALQMDQAAVESARLNLDYARIVSPLDGVVGVRLVDAGNLVHAADTASTIAVLTQLDPAAVFITLPQDDLVRVGTALQRGQVACEAWSRDGQTQLSLGVLSVVDNQINQSTSTLRLKARLPNSTHRLWPNQFVKARLLLDTRRGALVVPAAAVQRGPKGTFVYLVGTDQLAAQRPVEVALTVGDQAVVSSGLTVGEKVVIEGQNQLRPGAAVSARAAGAVAAPHSKGAQK